jgi:hypothetical protein
MGEVYRARDTRLGSEVGVIGVEGTGLRQITHGPADNIVPFWSRDGRFLHFVSNRTGRFEIWRVAAEGGTEDQVTRKGGVLPCETLDGRDALLFRRHLASTPSPVLSVS